MAAAVARQAEHLAWLGLGSGLGLGLGIGLGYQGRWSTSHASRSVTSSPSRAAPAEASAVITKPAAE